MEELNFYCCIAYPCQDDRVEASPFCQVHKDIHAKSKYPAILREEMALYEKKKKARSK